MGTVTYFVTQSYVSGEIANESKSRSDNDTSLDGRIKALEQTKNTVTSSLSSLETNINTLKADIDFKIGQSCRFSKLISGEMPKAQNEKEVISLIREKILNSKQDMIISEITKINNPELNEIVKLILKSLA